MVTIKQLATELAVSKQAIYNRITREPLRSTLDSMPGARQVSAQGTVYLSNEGADVVRSAYANRANTAYALRTPPAQNIAQENINIQAPTPMDGNATNSLNTKIDSLISLVGTMQKSVEDLTLQLHAKDKTIAQMQASIKEKDSLNDQLFEVVTAIESASEALEQPAPHVERTPETRVQRPEYNEANLDTANLESAIAQRARLEESRAQAASQHSRQPVANIAPASPQKTQDTSQFTGLSEKLNSTLKLMQQNNGEIPSEHISNEWQGGQLDMFSNFLSQVAQRSRGDDGKRELLPHANDTTALQVSYEGKISELKSKNEEYRRQLANLENDIIAKTELHSIKGALLEKRDLEIVRLISQLSEKDDEISKLKALLISSSEDDDKQLSISATLEAQKASLEVQVAELSAQLSEREEQVAELKAAANKREITPVESEVSAHLERIENSNASLISKNRELMTKIIELEDELKRKNAQAPAPLVEVTEGDTQDSSTTPQESLDKIAQLEEKIIGYEQQVATLTMAHTANEGQLAKLRSHLQEQTEYSTNISNQYNELLAALEEPGDDAVSKEEVAILKEKLEASELKASRIKSDLRAKEAKFAELKTAADTAKQENANLQAEIDNLKQAASAAAANEDHEAELAKAQEQLQELKTAANTAKQENANLQAEIDNLKQAASAATQENAALTAQLEELNAAPPQGADSSEELADAKAQIEELNEQLAISKNTVKRLNADVESRVESIRDTLTHEKGELQRELESTSQRAQQLDAQLNEAQATIVELTRDLKTEKLHTQEIMQNLASMDGSRQPEPIPVVTPVATPVIAPAAQVDAAPQVAQAPLPPSDSPGIPPGEPSYNADALSNRMAARKTRTPSLAERVKRARGEK